METVVISIVAFALAMLFLSLGTLFGRRRLRGSCGGLAGRRDQKGDFICACGTPSPECANSGDSGKTPVQPPHADQDDDSR